MLRGFGTLIDLTTGYSRRWVVGSDGIKRWADNSQPVEEPETAYCESDHPAAHTDHPMRHYDRTCPGCHDPCRCRQ